LEPAQLWDELGPALLKALDSYRAGLADVGILRKPDLSVVTDADLAIEALIVERISGFDPGAGIIAEESGNRAGWAGHDEVPERVWVVDPIDGTAAFLQPEEVDFCSVVCLLERGEPVDALVVAPELGVGRQPLVLTASGAAGTATVNGRPARPSLDRPPTWRVSATRSAGIEPAPFEPMLADAGYELRTRTTSQTIDMIRTAVDLSDVAADPRCYDLFVRARQKIWDGVAGLCFGAVTGLASADRAGRRRTPLGVELLTHPEPRFDSVVMGRPETVDRFLRLSR